MTKPKPRPEKAKEPTKEEPTMLATLTEAQAQLVSRAFAEKASAEARLEIAKVKCNDLLAMVSPKGANGFDLGTMSFFSVPPQPPTE